MVHRIPRQGWKRSRRRRARPGRSRRLRGKARGSSMMDVSRACDSVMAGNEIPGLLRRFGVVKELKVVFRDQSMVDEPWPVDESVPEVAPDQNDDEMAGLPGLEERQGFKEFVKRAESPRQGNQRPGPDEEMHLSHGKIAELETEFRRDVRIRALLVRQGDVQSDRFGADVRSAAIRRFHDARAAAGDDHIVATVADLTGRRDEASEFARDVVILGERKLPSRDFQPPLPGPVIREPCRLILSRPQQLSGGLRLLHPGAAEDDNGRLNTLFALDQFRFQQFQAYAYGTQVVSLKELQIAIGWNVGRIGRQAFHNAGDYSGTGIERQFGDEERGEGDVRTDTA
ncbi:protein of unknown function [Nitrospira japonica]|uniref:Uncharacterized protein n=1 Tax=Nitrospira japonica TaxID=1325564 RepID=A0A1W1I3F7_9BACT|nr:protein of unknown function [Nitrospira japonica]